MDSLDLVSQRVYSIEKQFDESKQNIKDLTKEQGFLKEKLESHSQKLDTLYRRHDRFLETHDRDFKALNESQQRIYTELQRSNNTLVAITAATEQKEKSDIKFRWVLTTVVAFFGLVIAALNFMK